MGERVSLANRSLTRRYAHCIHSTAGSRHRLPSSFVHGENCSRTRGQQSVRDLALICILRVEIQGRVIIYSWRLARVAALLTALVALVTLVTALLALVIVLLAGHYGWW